MSKKVLVQYNEDFGRSGSLSGTFITTEDKYNSLLGEKLYFYEVLGKHSEIMSRLTEKTLTIVCDDQEFLDKFVEILGEDWDSGCNPMDYIEETYCINCEELEDECDCVYCDYCGELEDDCECESEDDDE